MTKEFPHETIHRLAVAYSRACETVRAVDSFYGLRLIVAFALNFLYLITTPYFFINNLKDVDEAQIRSIGIFFTNGIKTCFWCVSHLLNLGMLIEPCHLTHAEMKKTREVVSRMIGYTNSVFDPLAVELQRFSRQLLLNDVSFRPLNVFTMSRGLLLTVLGSVTTYLVILIDIKY